MTARTFPGARVVRRPAGFTLVELLVVLLIIGLMTGIAVLGMRLTDDNGAQREAMRLRSLYALAHEDAEMQGRNLALGFWKRGWRFYELDAAGTWQVVVGDGVLRSRELASGLSLALRLDGLQVALPDEPPARPQVFLLASGEAQPFGLDLVRDGRARAQVLGDALGELRIEVAHAR